MAHLNLPFENNQCAMPPVRTVAEPTTRSTRIMAAPKCYYCEHYADHRIPVPPTVGNSNSSYDRNPGGGGGSNSSRACPCLLNQQRSLVTTPWTQKNPPPHYVPNRTPYECNMRVAGALDFIHVFGLEFLQYSLTRTDPSPVE